MSRRVVLQRLRDAGRAKVAPGCVCERGDVVDTGAVSGDVGVAGEWESREICDVEEESGDGDVVDCDDGGGDVTESVSNDNITGDDNNITGDDNNITGDDNNVTNNITNNNTNNNTNTNTTIITDSNSTGLISDIRRRLSATLTDALPDTPLDDSPADSLPADLELISNDAYNSVVSLALSHAAPAHTRLQRGSARHHAARVPASGALLDAATRAGRYGAGGDVADGELVAVGEALLPGQVAVLLLSAAATVRAERPRDAVFDEGRHRGGRDGSGKDDHLAVAAAAERNACDCDAIAT